jgi:hypothetical protein
VARNRKMHMVPHSSFDVVMGCSANVRTARCLAYPRETSRTLVFQSLQKSSHRIWISSTTNPSKRPRLGIPIIGFPTAADSKFEA